MQRITSTQMSLSEFLSKLQTRTSFSVDKDSSNHRAVIKFSVPFTWSDGREKIDSLTVNYDNSTEYINQITVKGNNLLQILGYTYMSENYLWFTIKDMSKFGVDHIEDIPGTLIINI